MGGVVFRQPNGLYGVFSTISNEIEWFNRTEASLLAHFATKMPLRDAQQQVWRGVADLKPYLYHHYKERPPEATTLFRFEDAMSSGGDEEDGVPSPNEELRDLLTQPFTQVWRWHCYGCKKEVEAVLGNLPDACCVAPTLIPWEKAREPKERIDPQPKGDGEDMVTYAVACFGGTVIGLASKNCPYPAIIAWAPPLRGFYAAVVQAFNEGKPLPPRTP